MFENSQLWRFIVVFFKKAPITFSLCFLYTFLEFVIFETARSSVFVQILWGVWLGIWVGVYNFIFALPVYALIVNILKSERLLAVLSFAGLMFQYYRSIEGHRDLEFSTVVVMFSYLGILPLEIFIDILTVPILILFLYSLYLIIRQYFIQKG